MATRFKQRVFGQRARRDKTHHIPFDDGFRPALFRFGRAFHLFTYSDAEPFADQGQQISLGRMHGYTTHGDVCAIMFATLGQRDVQCLGCCDRIVKEHLVEIAHAIKQKRTWMRLFDLEILRHQGRD